MKFISSLILTLIFGLLSLQSFAQKKIAGEIVSETDKTKLTNATVMLLQAKDSILVDFTRADANGKFSMTSPDTADFLLIVSYPKFGDYYQSIKKGSGDIQLGEIGLQSAASLIEEVLVTGRIPIVVKGDTVEYDAASFVTEKNAKVEDLLKVLPGISVDASGKITAQGKTVEKVLVDGEEFFGDDPTLVTRNIRSDMVDKVQVYEKKSEEAERTGVDDGARVQTINVKLKEDAKNGMFGKAEAAGGTDGDTGFYFGKMAFNRFKGSRKVSAFGIGSNDGQIGLGWQDEEKFGLGDDNMTMMEDGGVMFSFGGDPFSYWDGKGQPKALNGGVSYMDSWNEKKNKINLSYKYGRIENDYSENTMSETPLADSYSRNNKTNQTHSDANRHRFNTKYDLAIDSLTSMTLKVSGSRQENESSLESNGDSYLNDELRSNIFSNQQGKTKSQNISYDAYLTKKFMKEGRSLSFRFAGNNSEDDGTLLLYTELKNHFNNTDSITDQFKDKKSNSNNLRTSLTFTEAFGKKFRSSLGYEYSMSKSHSLNNSYNKDASGNYTIFDDVFSNDFNFNTIRNAVNLSLGYKTDKIEANLNNNIRHDDMQQQNNYANNSFGRDYLTYNPSARMRYNLSKTKSIGINYNFSNNLPSLFQIQPLRQNTDPMNEVFGNENLNPSKSNNYNIFYQSYEMMKGRYIYANLSFNQTYDAIQQNIVIEQDGARKLYYENMEKPTSSLDLWSGMGFDLIRKYQIKSNVRLSGGTSTSFNYINDKTGPNPTNAFQENRNDSYNASLSFGFERNTTKKIDFDWNFQPGFRYMKTSLNPERNSNGFTFNSNMSFKTYLPAKITLYGEGYYRYEAPTKALPERFSQVTFKPGVSKKFMKGENLILDFYVNDVFNQNKGFRRSQYAGAITQTTYNTISRYYMLKLTWEFTSMKGAN